LRYTVFLDPNSPDEFHFSPCHFCTAGHPPAGGSQLLLDPLFPRFLSFGFWRCSAARFQTLRRFLGSPTGITATSSVGISCCSSRDCIIPGSGLVSVASLQAVVSSNSDRTNSTAAFISRWMVSLTQTGWNILWVSFLRGWRPSWRSFLASSLQVFSGSFSVSLHFF
jgi:hypothetical protein